MKQIDIEDCCGCFACVSRCPKNAISVKEDETGFLYPSIDSKVCIDCGACVKVCSFIKETKTESNSVSAYGLQYKNRTVLNNSASGGAFTAISDLIHDMGGCVVGAIMDKDFNVHHAIADTKEERDLMRGSKYVQSSTEGIYEEIEERLKKGQTVLFTGTSCQTAAVKSYFEGKYEQQLITMDVICHGVPSVKMLRDHIKYIADRSGKEPAEYYFRSKEFGWRAAPVVGVRFKDSSSITYSEYMYRLTDLFSDGAALRPSCHNCKYRGKFRHSDITVSDFWGIDKIAPEKNNKLGHSLIFVNSEKGQELLDAVIADNKSDVFNIAVDDVLFRFNKKMSVPKDRRDKFWKAYSENGYEYILQMYTKTSLKRKARFIAKKLLLRQNDVELSSLIWTEQ